MRAVTHSAALPDQVPYAAAEAAFAEAEAFLCSREARQMSESDLERELHRRGQELMRKLLQGVAVGNRVAPVPPRRSVRAR